MLPGSSIRPTGSHARCRARLDLPGDFTRSGVDVRHTREHEKEIREAVQVDHNERRNLYLALEVHPPPLGPAAHRAGDVEHGTLATSAGNDERSQRLELLFAVVDRVLQVLDAAV